MTTTIELWHLILLLLAFFGACWAFAKVLLNQIQKNINDRLAALEATTKQESGQWQRVERELLNLKADLPLHYVRREDYIRGQSIIEAKLDGLASKIENGFLRGNMNGVHP